jgi:hypothetical protein
MNLHMNSYIHIIAFSGLYLLLYLQTSEFIPGLTNGYGVKVIVNERGTVPLPDDDGVFVAANSETDIAMKRVSQKSH